MDLLLLACTSKVSVVHLVKMYLFLTAMDTCIRTYVNVQVQECMQIYSSLISNDLWENTEISYKTINISMWKKIKPNLQ